MTLTGKSNLEAGMLCGRQSLSSVRAHTEQFFCPQLHHCSSPLQQPAGRTLQLISPSCRTLPCGNQGSLNGTPKFLWLATL